MNELPKHKKRGSSKKTPPNDIADTAELFADNQPIEFDGYEFTDEEVDLKKVLNPAAETAVVNLLSDFFSSVLALDLDSVHTNILLGCPGGFSEADRSIRIELGDYIMSHFSLIFTGLIVNPDFRETFFNAVELESALMEENTDTVSEIRQELIEREPVHESKGNYVIDFSKYNDMIYHQVNNKLVNSFERFRGYESALEDFADALTEDDRAQISFVISNFMLLFRAFAQNGRFSDYVKEVLHVVQSDLNIE